MRKLHPKPQAITGPDAVFITKADGLPVIPVELGQRRRKPIRRCLIRRIGQRAGDALQPRVVERLGCAALLGASRGGATRRGRFRWVSPREGCRDRNRCDPAQESSSTHPVIANGKTEIVPVPSTVAPLAIQLSGVGEMDTSELASIPPDVSL